LGRITPRRALFSTQLLCHSQKRPLAIPKRAAEGKRASTRGRRLLGEEHTLQPAEITIPESLFSEILKRDLDAVVVHLLVLGLGLLAALCAAMEESDYVPYRGTTLPIERVDLRR
jgi:hypothetical protein